MSVCVGGGGGGEVEGSLTKYSADYAVTDRFRMHRSAEMSETVN